MIQFYNKSNISQSIASPKIFDLREYDRLYFNAIYTFNLHDHLCKNQPKKINLKLVRKIFMVENLTKTEIENHIIDHFPLVFKDKSPIFLFLFLCRHCENNEYWGSVEFISDSLNQSQEQTLSDLASLEEFNLIKISGYATFYIRLNRNWQISRI